METFSIWLWMYAVFLVGLPVIGIATVGRERQLRRVDYAKRLAGLLAVNIIFGVAVREDVETFGNVVLLVVVLLVAIATVALSAVWSAHRLNHIGWTRWLALLSLVPFVNIFGAIGLCLVPGWPQEPNKKSPGRRRSPGRSAPGPG